MEIKVDATKIEIKGREALALKILQLEQEFKNFKDDIEGKVDEIDRETFKEYSQHGRILDVRKHNLDSIKRRIKCVVPYMFFKKGLISIWEVELRGFRGKNYRWCYSPEHYEPDIIENGKLLWANDAYWRKAEKKEVSDG